MKTIVALLASIFVGGCSLFAPTDKGLEAWATATLTLPADENIPYECEVAPGPEPTLPDDDVSDEQAARWARSTVVYVRTLQGDYKRCRIWVQERHG